MVEFTLFEPDDLSYLGKVRPIFDPSFQTLLSTPSSVLSLICNDYTWTGWSPYGTALACAGILPNGEAWALLRPSLSRSEAIAITRKVRRVLYEHCLQRGIVFAKVNREIGDAVRWAHVLGFERLGLGATWTFRCASSTTPSVQ